MNVNEIFLINNKDFIKLSNNNINIGKKNLLGLLFHVIF